MMPPESQGSVEPLLTAADVAEILQLSVRTVRRLIAENKLPIVRIGRRVRMRGEDLRSFVDAAANRGQEVQDEPK
jgi:excisionase family DNA binding protein